MNRPLIEESIKTLQLQVQHRRAPYEGDGAPGCVSWCPRCALEDLEFALKDDENV